MSEHKMISQFFTGSWEEHDKALDVLAAEGWAVVSASVSRNGQWVRDVILKREEVECPASDERPEWNQGVNTLEFSKLMDEWYEAKKTFHTLGENRHYLDDQQAMRDAYSAVLTYVETVRPPTIVAPALVGTTPDDDTPNGEFVPFWMAAYTIEDIMSSPEMQSLIRTGRRIDAVRLYRKSRNHFHEAKLVVDLAIKFAQLPQNVITVYQQVDANQLGTRDARVWLKDLYEAVGKHISQNSEVSS